MDIMWRYMDIMKLMTVMPIEIRQDLVADGAFASDSHCKIIGFPIAPGGDEIARVDDFDMPEHHSHGP